VWCGSGEGENGALVVWLRRGREWGSCGVVKERERMGLLWCGSGEGENGADVVTFGGGRE
jgi:hypothetical protein